MAYPRHALVTFGGTVVGSASTEDEIWQCGVRLDGDDSGFLSDPDSYLSDIATPLETWYAASSSVMRGDSHLKWVKANNIAADGTYADPVTHVHDYATPVAGGAAAGPMPAMLTCCFSWVTAAARGPAHTGRIYPPVWLPATSSEIISDANRTSYANSGKDLLLVLANGFADVFGQPSVVSKVGIGYKRHITGVRVGSVIDVQRRRKNALPEVYSSVAFP